MALESHLVRAQRRRVRTTRRRRSRPSTPSRHVGDALVYDLCPHLAVDTPWVSDLSTALPRLHDACDADSLQRLYV